MNRIDETFQKVKKQGRKAFIGYSMVGYPDLNASQALAEGLLKEGCDLLELGIPFSDPLADGPVIQKAADTALTQGASLKHGFDLARRLRGNTQAPLLIMSYYNPLLQRGVKECCAEAKQAGVDGFIVPDLPPEEAKGFAASCHEHGLCLILLASPTSTPQRLKKIASMASGFIYFVSVAGVTGEHKTFDAALGPAIQALRKVSRLPLAIGFGVSSEEKAREAAALADGVVVASAVLKMIQEAGNQNDGLNQAISKAKSLIEAVHSF